MDAAAWAADHAEKSTPFGRRPTMILNTDFQESLNTTFPTKTARSPLTKPLRNTTNQKILESGHLKLKTHKK